MIQAVVVVIDLRQNKSKQYVYSFKWYCFIIKFIVDSQEVLQKLFLLFSFIDNSKSINKALLPLNFKNNLFVFYFGNKYSVKFDINGINYIFYFADKTQAEQFSSIIKQQ